jgi:hypothetical protein
LILFSITRIFRDPMPKTARKALAALLISLHAMISLCGAGLHAAPGLGHPGPTGTSRKLDGHLEWRSLAATTSEHCPICDYVSQGQLPLPRAFSVSSRLVLPFTPAAVPILAPSPSLLSCRSRAPPLNDARIV